MGKNTKYQTALRFVGEISGRPKRCSSERRGARTQRSRLVFRVRDIAGTLRPLPGLCGPCARRRCVGTRNKSNAVLH